MFRTKTILLSFFMLSFFTLQAQDGWKDLFNGKNLKGWKQLNGKALHKVEDGVIVGTSVGNTPNSFLTTKKDYGDFILELEVMVDPNLNSGIQIRSLSTPEYMDGRVHGYQVEIDPSDRAWSGGIYDEARRGWLYNLTQNKKGGAAFKVGQWNKYRIEAIGSSIRTWVNGVQCSNLVDDMTASGFICLQVHSIRDPEMAGTTVKWRNIRIKTEDLESSRMQGDDVMEISYLTNQLTDHQQKEGWKLLWDGKTTEGWRGAKLDGFPEKGWEMKDGVLAVLSSGGAESRHGGDIITTDTYSNFELEVDFMITEGANSGIKYYVDPELNKGEGSAIGLEFQLLDDKEHPDASQGVAGNRTLASLYDLIARENLSEPGRKDIRFTGVGKWNRARIVSKDNHIEHWLNNVKVVSFERGTQMYRALVAYSKYKIWPNFGEVAAGHILLQDHGDTVHFKNIKIKEL